VYIIATHLRIHSLSSPRTLGPPDLTTTHLPHRDHTITTSSSNSGGNRIILARRPAQPLWHATSSAIGLIGEEGVLPNKTLRVLLEWWCYTG
jgi:hypothetical protein